MLPTDGGMARRKVRIEGLTSSMRFRMTVWSDCRVRPFCQQVFGMRISGSSISYRITRLGRCPLGVVWLRHPGGVADAAGRVLQAGECPAKPRQIGHL